MPFSCTNGPLPRCPFETIDIGNEKQTLFFNRYDHYKMIETNFDHFDEKKLLIFEIFTKKPAGPRTAQGRSYRKKGISYFYIYIRSLKDLLCFLTGS